jgi:amino acid adenylation domain-containing protein
MVVALLGVLKAGGAYVPLDPEYPSERVGFMLTDGLVSVLLTEQRLSKLLPAADAQVIWLDQAEAPLPVNQNGRPQLAAQPENLAYVIYTSGSTGLPKGVAITHQSATTMLHWAQEVFSGEQLRGVLASTSICFDLSVFEMFLPLSVGGKVILARNALELPQLAAKDEVSLINTVPSAMAELVRTEGVPATVTTVNLAGEALKSQLVQQIYEHTGASQVWNLYGPSEDTTYSTFALIPKESNGVVPIGRPVACSQVYLLDQQLQPVPVGVSAVLYLGGAGLARGYLGRPALTAEKFIPDPFATKAGARLYRTGDLARYLPDGNLEYLGRVDHQVKLRGYRVELGEVEARLAGHSGVRESVVLVRDDEQRGPRLVAYVVPGDGESLSASQLREYLRHGLPAYMIPAQFVMLERMPLTSNGKLDRTALYQLDSQSGQFEASYAEPADQLEEMLVEIWASVLGVERVGVHDNFFDLGGHSLLAAQVLSRVQKAFKTEIPLRLLFEFPTVAGFAKQIAAIRQDDLATPPSFALVSRAESLPLSFAQQRLWFLDQLEPGCHAYNMPGAVRISGPLNRAVLEKSLSEIVRRHETLRTHFSLTGGEPVQIIDDAAPLNLAVLDLRELPLGERDTQLDQILTSEAREPFDLARGPLLRMKLVVLTDEEHVLAVTMHHIVSDGWSLGLFLRELAALYRANAEGMESPLPPLPIQYADFASWQRNWLRDEKLSSLLAYWVKQLKGAPPFLELPTDHSRRSVRSYNGARQSVLLPQSLTDELKRLSREEGVTLFMVLAAAFKVLLYRYSGQTDIVVGTVSANRNQPEIEELIGFFVNTLVLRTDLLETRTFRALLAKIRETVIDACTYQDLPFEKLVEELQPERDTSRTPLFQVLLVEQKQLTPELDSAGVCFRPVELDTLTTKFDLTLNFAETDRELHLTLEYSTDLFEAATAERMLGHLHTLLEHAAANPAQQISELPLVTNDEQQKLLRTWNDTAREYPAECVHSLFEKQARLTPNAAALIFNDDRLTYREINTRANQIAHLLQRLGVGPESLVGIYTERTPEMMSGILGVLKAGGAYVPIDPAYPPERIKLILSDSGLRALLTQTDLLENLPELDVPAICLDNDLEMLPAQSTENPASDVQPENLAYVIYTSGSTGVPKGVAITHGSVTTMLRWAQEVFSAEQLRGVLASTSICFDLSVFEMFLPLSVGGKVILARDALELPQLAARDEVSLINTVPSAMAELIRTAGVPETVKTINLGGEAVKAELVQQIYEHTGASQVWDLYGPTEDTVYSTYSLLPEQGQVTIGRPIACSQAYLLDQNLQPVPVGVTAELYLGGAGVARGYLNRPALTAEKFIPDPFGTKPGARLYRTGDLARYLPDGDIEYLGRMDHQVKIRGFRIELGEIETALSRHPIVKDVVVSIREDISNDKRLVAYVVLNQQCPAPVDELRRALKEKLPSFMIPNTFVLLEALPLTPNGKIDRKALPAPDQTRRDTHETFVPPRTPIEEMIAAIWSQVLHLERVGIYDNFFSLGGHSLLATQVVHRLRETFNVALPLRLLFETPTVADLAECVTRSQVGEADDATLSAALAELSHLSPEETESLLAAQTISTEMGSLS